MPLKLISLNIEGNFHLDKVLPFLSNQKPDVICLQETYKVNLPLFEKKLKMKSHFYPMADVNKPHPLNFPQLGEIGLAILTSLSTSPIKHKHYYQAPGKLPFIGYQSDQENRLLFWTTIKKDSQAFTIATTHFTWAMPEKADQAQASDLNKLLIILKTIPKFILCGDFNAPRGQKTFDHLASIYTDNIPQHVTTTIDPQIHRAGNLKLVVDGLFSTPHYQVKNVQIQCGVSDHCAIIADITKPS